MRISTSEAGPAGHRPRHRSGRTTTRPGGRLGPRTWHLALGIACTLLAGSALAAAKWWHEVPLKVDVHEHAFNRATANNVDCKVRFRLYFVAPPKQYTDERNAVRNHYRMKAQIKLGDQVVYSPEFVNSAPGRRVYAFSHDTESQGCWAREKHKIWQVNVNACRNSGCRVEPFE